MPQIRIEDIDIDIVRKNIKNLYLAIIPPLGRVRITAPKRMDNETIRHFVTSKLTWIQKRVIKYTQPKQKLPLKYISGESYYFQGKQYFLNVIEKTGRSKVVIRETFIDLYINSKANIEARQQVLNKWYRNELFEKASALIIKWQHVIGPINDFRIKKMKSRWGSCNIKARRIWLNLELIKKPEPCLEYIVVHEMVHLLERRHNDRFKQFMDLFLPHWRDIKKMLRNS